MQTEMFCVVWDGNRLFVLMYMIVSVICVFILGAGRGL